MSKAHIDDFDLEYIQEGKKIAIDNYRLNYLEFSKYYYYTLFGTLTSFFFVYTKLESLTNQGHFFSKIAFIISIVCVVSALFFWIIKCLFSIESDFDLHTYWREQKKIQKYIDKKQFDVDIGQFTDKTTKLFENISKSHSFAKSYNNISIYFLFIGIIIYVSLLVYSILPNWWVFVGIAIFIAIIYFISRKIDKKYNNKKTKKQTTNDDTQTRE